MVREPVVFLLDEPLSNLDAKMRTELRDQIIRLHERLKTTFVYVTHDQAEAMQMGDRLAIMDMGRIVQTGHAAGNLRPPELGLCGGLCRRAEDQLLRLAPAARRDRLEHPAAREDAGAARAAPAFGHGGRGGRHGA